MMPPQRKGSAGIHPHVREVQQFEAVRTAEELQWECRCTLLNLFSFSRCIACGTPKPRQQQQQQQQHDSSSGRVSAPAVPDDGGAIAVTATGVAAAVKRGRKRHSPTGQCKRIKTLPGSRNGTAVAASPVPVDAGNPRSHNNNRSGGVSSSLVVASPTAGGGGSSGVGGVVVGAGERKRSGPGSSSSKGSGSSSGVGSSRRNAKSSAVPIDSAAATPGAEANGNVISEGAATAEAEIEDSRQRLHNAMELHKVKRKAVGAALARSAFSRLESLTWEDVSVDWCPKERLTEAERRTSGLLEISALGIGAGARDGAGGRSSRGGNAAAQTEGTAGSPAPRPAPLGGEEELCMSALFPLPQPKPARYVKKGLLAVESGTATPQPPLASELKEMPAMAPSQPLSNGTIPEGEAVVPHSDRAAESGKASKMGVPEQMDGMAEQMATNGGNSSSGNASGSGSGNPLAAESGEAAKARADTDSNNSDNSASTSATAAYTGTTQYGMSAAARMKAYKGIFRTGGDKLKKRPRSPIASTPLHLPFPVVPSGGSTASLATADLEERPPCGTEEYVQTEFGSEWAWGLLTGPQLDGGGGGGGAGEVGKSNGGDEEAGGGGPSYRDFRLPYEVIYDCHQQDFVGEMRQLGMRSAEDAMGEFKSITSNVYLSKKVCSAFGVLRVSDAHRVSLQENS